MATVAHRVVRQIANHLMDATVSLATPLRVTAQSPRLPEQADGKLGFRPGAADASTAPIKARRSTSLNHAPVRVSRLARLARPTVALIVAPLANPVDVLEDHVLPIVAVVVRVAAHAARVAAQVAHAAADAATEAVDLAVPANALAVQAVVQAAVEIVVQAAVPEAARQIAA